MPTAPEFQFITLGRLALLDPTGQELLAREAAKPLAVLAYLAACPGRRCSRERLVDLFWGDSALEQGRSSLRQLLYRLRDALGEGAFRSETNDVQLVASLTTDRDEFLHALEHGDLEAALTLYGGLFIAAFVSRGTTQFEQWRDQEQDRLHDLFTNTVDVVGQRAIAEGRFHDAAALAQRVLQDQPLDERGWRLRLQAEQLAGSRIHLTASIAELRRLFANEGWEPQLRTTQLLDALERTRADTSERSAGEPLDGDLVGRGAVMSALYQHWRAVSKRSGRHVHLVGGAGLGKTRVMDDFAVRLRAERGRVVRVGAYPRQRFIPGSMLASLIAALAELPGAGSIGPDSARILIDLQPTVSARFLAASPAVAGNGHPRAAAVNEAVHDLIEATTEDGAFCLLLDDAHWWDEESRQVIEGAIERLHDRSIFVVTASRPGSGVISTGLTREQIELTRWCTDDVLALLQSLGSSDEAPAAEALAAALAAAAEGVPLLVIEALRLGLDRELIDLTDRKWNTPRLAEFLTLLQPGQLLRERASTLTIQERHLLLVTWLAESDILQDDWHTVDGNAQSSTPIELERLGFLQSSGHGWKIGHDAIGEAIEAAASANELAHAHRDAGELLLLRGDHPVILRQAASHAQESGDLALQQQVSVRWISQRRLHGSGISAIALLAEIFPGNAPKSTLVQLARGLPNELRRTPWSVRRLAPIWAVAGAAAVLVGFWLAARSVEPDAVIGIFVGGSLAEGNEVQLALRHANWGDGEPEATTPKPSDRWRFTRRDSMSNSPVADPSGTRWLLSTMTSTAGGPSELILLADGVKRTLAPAEGDDNAPAWSPDGRFAVFISMRWSHGLKRNFDLGIVNVATGKVRQLTQTEDDEFSPFWSPDGTRIAYFRRAARLAPNALCWISVDGARGNCEVSTDRRVEGVLGWTDAHTILTQNKIASGCSFSLVDINVGTSRQVQPYGDCDAALSPDGSWLARVPTRTMGDRRVHVTSLTGLELTRSVGGKDVNAIYWRGPWRRDFIDAVSIQRAGDTVTSGVRYQLRLAGISKTGAELEVPPQTVEWRTSDPSVSVVDSLGLIRPVANGSVMIIGTAGGWRADSVRLVVAHFDAQAAFEEEWTGRWEKRWERWGLPLPFVARQHDGRFALLVNGDEEYESGITSFARIDPTRGAAVDVRMSTPISRSKWQNLRVQLGTIGPLTQSGPAAQGDGVGCSFGYPSGEGWNGLAEIGTSAANHPAEKWLASGRWYTVRLQLFPDGTCGFALDGRAIARGNRPHALTDSVGVVLKGQMVGSSLLIGTVKAWSGVPTDVDWEAIPKPLTAPPRPH